MAKEVSCKVLDTIFDALEAKGKPADAVLHNTELTLEYLRNPKGRIDWPEFAQIMRNVRQHAGFSKEDFIGIGLGIFDTSVVQMLGVIARSLYSLPEFYLWYHNQDKSKVNRSLTACVYTECSHDSEMNFVIRLNLMDDAEPIEEFFWTSLGVVMGWPKVYGLQPVEVEMQQVPNGCEYRFKCPKSGGWLSGLRKIIMWPFTAKTSAQQLALANNEVYEQYRQLEIENAKLRATEERLQLAIKKAEQASQVKTNFITNITHEIRTPLNAIMGINSLCIESAEARANGENHLMMQTAIDRLVYTFEDIIDFNLLADSQVTLRPTTVAMVEWLERQIKIHQRNAIEQGLQFNYFHSLPEDLTLQQDWHRVAQVIRILLSNAVKFTTDGKIDMQIEYRDNELQISMCDTGIGIPPEQAQTIFQPLQTATESHLSRSNTGIGLGLPLAKASIESMGGSIEHRANLPQGTCFRVSVPVVEAELSDETENYEEKSLEILLAEDNKVNSIIIFRMGELLGHHIHVVENGKLATEFVQQHKVDLVLMDLMMPVMDGITASKVIRQHYSTNELPIVAISANITPNDYDGLMEIGINQCTTKPINLETFKHLLRPYQRRHQQPNYLPSAR